MFISGKVYHNTESLQLKKIVMKLKYKSSVRTDINAKLILNASDSSKHARFNIALVSTLFSTGYVPV